MLPLFGGARWVDCPAEPLLRQLGLPSGVESRTPVHAWKQGLQSAHAAAAGFAVSRFRTHGVAYFIRVLTEPRPVFLGLDPLVDSRWSTTARSGGWRGLVGVGGGSQ